MTISKEKSTVEKMIYLYCKLNHHQKDLCSECSEIKEYAINSLDSCPLKENKPSCKNCTIHCYSEEKKQKIKEIMRFSGPRMLRYHPMDFFKHFLKLK